MAGDLDRRGFLRLVGAGAAALALPGRPAWAAPARKPNIVLILADDLGYGELGVYGGKDVPTPHIDSIARDGVRFTDGYVSCPVCAPTRAGLMTGRYQERFGLELNPGPPPGQPGYGLPLEEATIAERLKPLGYATGMVGKWHLGYTTDRAPNARGFDEFFGFLAGSDAYLPPRPSPILRNTTVVQEPAYLTDAFAREAAGYIGKHAAEPFFLYFAPNAVHNPAEATEKYLARFPNLTGRRRTFAAQLSALDDAVGEVLQALREQKLEQDTLVVFLSDNGGPTPQTSSANGPLRGTKGQVYEGGTRVPFMAKWPGHIKAGQVYREPVISLDLHPTFVKAAGGSAQPQWRLDGVDLLSWLDGKQSGRPHETLYWRFGDQWAIRQGDWKLLSPRTGTPELYHLSEDLGEAHDLAAQEPARAKALQEAWQAWSAQLVPPKWTRAGTPAPRRARRRRLR